MVCLSINAKLFTIISFHGLFVPRTKSHFDLLLDEKTSLYFGAKELFILNRTKIMTIGQDDLYPRVDPFLSMSLIKAKC